MKKNDKTGQFINEGALQSGFCAQCGQKINFYKSRTKKFCSLQCASKNKIKKRKTFICEECGVEFHPKRNEKKRKYCSAKCFNIGLRLTRLGENHHNFGKTMPLELRKKISQANKGKKAWNKKGDGITSKDRLERCRFRVEMQKKVFERDNYTCQICGKRGCKLQVDHIQPWADYVELRFNMENLRTLCMDCHYFITFGREKPKEVLTWGHNLSQIGGY